MISNAIKDFAWPAGFGSLLRAGSVVTASLLLILVALGISQSSDLPPSAHKPSTLFTPEKGFVPDKITAVRIAEAVWLPIYGEDVLEKKPFEAELVGDSVWIVAGTLPKEWTVGGVPYIEILRVNGKIIGVSHGK